MDVTKVIFWPGIIVILLAAGCGVKGDPKPPLTPVALGHGQPSFKRATKNIVPAPPPDANQLSKDSQRDSAKEGATENSEQE